MSEHSLEDKTPWNDVDEDELEQERVFVTGGTGTLGKAVVRRLIMHGYIPVVFSRDECKQEAMQVGEFAREYAEGQIEFRLGDVREADRVMDAMAGCSLVVHTAAMKQVPAAENNPMECLKTNVWGAESVVNAAKLNDVRRVVALSSDKASSPSCLYGASKMCADKIFCQANQYDVATRDLTSPEFVVVRLGNIFASRGSVVPLFLKHLKAGRRMPVTNLHMTRFSLTDVEAADYVMQVMEHCADTVGYTYVPKLKAFQLRDLADACYQSVYGVTSEGLEDMVDVVGIRSGEKMHEEMISVADYVVTVDFGGFYLIPPAWEESQTRRHAPLKNPKEPAVYSSEKAVQMKEFRLTVPELVAMIKMWQE